MDLSIIIPTLNEAENIQHTIALAKSRLSRKYKVEFILIDAGSTDATMDIATPLVEVCISDISLKGAKYKSLNKGASLARGKFFLFLDADCEVSNQFDAYIMEALTDPKVVGGAFEFQMDGSGLQYRAIELVNRVRYRLTQNYFGDQGVFCTRLAFEAVDGYPAELIMEAAYFCKNLRRIGKLRLIRAKLKSSVRRFEEGGVWHVMAKDTWIWAQFLLGLDIKRYGKAYWTENERGE